MGGAPKLLGVKGRSPAPFCECLKVILCSKVLKAKGDVYESNHISNRLDETNL